MPIDLNNLATPEQTKAYVKEHEDPSKAPNINPITGQDMNTEMAEMLAMSGSYLTGTSHSFENDMRHNDMRYTSNENWQAYKGYDINLSPNMDWDKQRAQAQGGGAQLAGFLNQALVGEIVGGTLEGIGTLWDWTTGSTAAEKDFWTDDHGNWLSELGEGMRTWTQEATPIYAENPGEFDPGDPGWWASGGVSVASFASMMIPAAGTVRGLSMLGRVGKAAMLTTRLGKGIAKAGSFANASSKASRLGKYFNAVGKANPKMAKFAARGEQLIANAPNAVAQAIVSRNLESIMEGGQVYKELENQYIEDGFSLDEAKKLAALGAADTFVQDRKLLGMDVAQYMLAGNVFSFKPGLLKMAEKAGGRVGKLATMGLAHTANLGFQVGTEAFEEGLQFINQEEGKYLSRKASGLMSKENLESTKSERIDRYMKEGEFKTSAFFGGFGGGLFHMVEPLVDKAAMKTAGKTAKLLASGMSWMKIQEHMERDAQYRSTIMESDMHGSKKSSKDSRVRGSIREEAARAKDGTLDNYIEVYKADAEMTDKKIEEYNEANPDNPQTREFANIPAEVVKRSNRIQEVYDEHVDQYGPEVSSEIAKNVVTREVLEESIRESEGAASALEADMPLISDMSPEGRRIFDLKLAEKQATANATYFDKTLKGVTDVESRKILERHKKENEDHKADLAKELTEAKKAKRDIRSKAKDSAAMDYLKDSGTLIAHRAEAAMARANREVLAKDTTALKGLNKEEVSNNAEQAKIDALTTPSELNAYEEALKLFQNLTPEIAEAISAKRVELNGVAAIDEDKKHAAQNIEDLETKGSQVTTAQVTARLENLRVNKEDPKLEETVEELEKIDSVENIEATVATHENTIRSEGNNEHVETQRTSTQKNGAPQQEKGKFSKNQVGDDADPTVQGKDYPLEQARTSTTAFHKENMTTIAWKSINNGGEPTGRIKEFSDLAEDPDRSMEGSTVEFSIDKELTPEATEDMHLDDVVIKVTVLGKDNTPMTINEVEVYAHLHRPNFSKNNPNFTVAKRRELRRLREQIITEIQKGNRVSTKITEVKKGHLLEEKNEDRSVEHSIRTVMPEGAKATLMISTKRNGVSSLLFGSNQPVKGKYELFETNDPGITFLDTVDNNGDPFNLRLNARNLNDAEVDTIVAVYKKLAEGANKFSEADLPGISGLRYVDVLNFLVSEGDTATTGRKSVLKFDDQAGGVVYGNAEATMFLQKEMFGQGQEDSFRTWLKGNKTRYANLSKLNRPMTEFVSKRGTANKDFTLMGKDYTKENSYNDFLIDDMAVSTNAYTRNGRLFVQPTIEFDPNVVVAESVANQDLDAQITAEVKTTNETEKGTDERTLDEAFGDGAAITPKNRVTDYGAVNYTIANVEQEVAWIRYNLPSVPVKLVNGLLRVNDQGGRAYGAFKNGMIALSNMMDRGTSYHEAFHAVFNLYLDETQRSAVFAEALGRYGMPSEADVKAAKVNTVEEWLEEQLAEGFRLYQLSDGRIGGYAKNIKGLFDQLLDLIKSVFTNKVTVNRLFDQISKGHFRNKPVTAKVNRMSDVVRHQRVPDFTTSQTKDMAETLVAEIIQQTNAFESEDLNHAITSNHLSAPYLKRLLKGYAIAAVKAEKQGLVNVYVQAADHIEIIQSKIIDKFKTMSLNVTVEQEQLRVEDLGDEGLGLKPAFEYSGKDNATGNVRMLLSTLPKMNSQKAGDYKLNAFTGRPQLASLAGTWGALASGLSDIVDIVNPETGDLTSAYAQMMDKLIEMSVVRPEFALLHSKLTDPGYPREKKNQFFNAFSQAAMNFRTTTVVGNAGDRTYKTKDSNFNSADKQIRYEWADFMSRQLLSLDKDNNVVANVQAAQALKDTYNNLTAEAVAAGRANEPIDGVKRSFKTLLDNTGIKVSEQALEHFIAFRGNTNRAGKTEGARVAGAIKELQEAFNFGLDSIINGGQELDTWVTTEKAFTDLAKVEAMFRDDLSESTVIGADNATYYTYSLNNFMFKSLRELLQNPAKLKKLRQVPYNTSSRTLRHLSDGGNLEIEVFNSLKKENSKDTGDKYVDLSPVDEMSTRISQTMNGHFSMLTAADKSVWYLLKGMPVLDAGIVAKGGDYVFSNRETLDIFGRYFLDELGRMRQAWGEVKGPRALPEEQQIQYYHNGPANAFKSSLFPELSPFREDEKGNTIVEESPQLKELGIYMSSQDFKAHWNTKAIENIYPVIKEALKARVEADFNQAVELGVINVEEGRFTNNSLDAGQLAKYLQPGLDIEISMREMMADYTVNAMIANIETTKLFTGDPAFYKNSADLQKRVPGTIAPGQDLVLLNEEDVPFNIAVLDDIEISISDTLYSQYKSAIEKSYKDAGLEISEERIAEMLKPYKEVNVADAQAYVTLERYRDLLKMLGKWRETEMAAPFERLINGETLRPEDKLFLQPLKGMYFGTRDGGHKAVPTYLKYSLAPLIPGLIRGTELANLREKMGTEIQEVIFNSGVKVGAMGQTAVGSTEALTPIQLDNRNWKLQQDMTAKYMKKGKAIEPSQVIKNVLANIDLEADYNGVKGGDIVRDFINTDRALSDLGAEEFRKEFGVEVNDAIEHVGFEPGSQKLYDTLIAELKGKDAPEQVIEMLEAGEPLDAIPQFRKKIQQTILSILNKRTVKMDMPGGAFVQMSSAMFNYMQEGGQLNSDIVWLNGGAKLLPPRKEGGVVKAGQVLLPSSAFEAAKEAMPGASMQEIGEALQAAGLLEGVGARIPNQDMSSTDYLEVAGILPAYMGDTIVTYDSITAKTGSDYDIDKMYVMLPNFEAVYNRDINTRTEFLTKYRKAFDAVRRESRIADLTDGDILQQLLESEESFLSPLETKIVETFKAEKRGEFVGLKKVDITGKSRKALQNRKLALYKEILTSPQTFSRLVTPIDSQWLKDQAIAIRTNRKDLSRPTKYTSKGLEFYSAKTQFEKKMSFTGGKFGVGLTANQLVDHPLTQLAGVTMVENLGIGNVTTRSNNERPSDTISRSTSSPEFSDVTSFAGKYDTDGGLITSNISAYLNAFVDIAKDPYIFDLNMNTYTANTAFMLLRAGVPPIWVNNLISQPIVRELARTAINMEGRTAKTKYNESGVQMKPEDVAKTFFPTDEKVQPYSEVSMPDVSLLKDELVAPTSIGQQTLLELFMKLKVQGDSFGRQVTAFKFDTVGAGKTLIDATISMNKLDEALNDPSFENVEKRLDGSMVETYAKNSAGLSSQLFPSIMIGASTGVLGKKDPKDKRTGIMSIISTYLGKPNITSATLATKIENDTYSFIMEKFSAFHATNPIDLFSGPTSMGAKVLHAKYGVDSKLKENLLIQNLKVQEEGEFSFARISKNKDSNAKNNLAEAWEELIYSANPNTAKFGKDLVRYAFYASGLNTKGGSFFDVIPARYLQEQKLGDFIKKQSDRLNDKGGADYLTSFVGQFFRNNSSDQQIVPVVEKEAYRFLDESYADAFQVNEKHKKFVTGADEQGKPVFSPYLNMNDTLYKIQGYIDSKGVAEAVYARTSKLGFQGERNMIKEFGTTISQFNEAGVKIPKNFLDRTYSPVAEIIRKQKFSHLTPENANDLDAKLQVLQKAFPTEIRYDNTLTEIAKVEQTENGPVITLNPEKLQSDTIIHEYGHIYINALGLDSTIVKEGIEQLRGTDLWNQVREIYPELSEAQIGEEVLATAIGMEGADLFNQSREQNNSWKRWLSEFWQQIKEILGIQPSVARALARDLLTNQLQANAENRMDTMVRKQKTPIEIRFSEDEKALEKVVDVLRAGIDLKVKERSRYVNNRKDSPEIRRRKEKNLEELEELAENMGKVEGFRAILAFSNAAMKDTKKATATLAKGVRTGNLSSDRLRNLQAYISTYNVLGNVQQVLARESLFREGAFGKGKIAELQEYIGTIENKYAIIKKQFNEVYLDVLASELHTDTHLVETRKRIELENEFRNNNPNEKTFGKRRDYEAARDKWVNSRMAEMSEEIKSLEWTALRELLATSTSDISMLTAIVMDPRGINDQLLQLGTKMVDRADYSSMREFQGTYKDLYAKFQVFRGLSGQALITKMSELNKKFIIQETQELRPLERIQEQLDAGTIVQEEFDYYKGIKELFEKADSLLPDHFKFKGRLPGIRKRSMEKLAEKGIISYAKEYFQDKLKTQSDDTDSGEVADLSDDVQDLREGITAVLANEAGEEARFVPIHFQAKLGKEDQSNDLFNMALSTYYMALNFQNKTAVAPRLQLLQDAVRNQTVQERNSKGLLKVIKGALNINIQKKGQSNISKAFDSMVATRLYGIETISAGEFMGLDMKKVAQSLMGLSGDVALIFNYPSGVANLLQGHIATLVESRGGRYFNGKDVAIGQKQYAADLANVMADIANDNKAPHSKMNLMIERYDMMGEFDGLVNSILDDSKLKRLLKKEKLHGFNGMAEHYIQGVLMTSAMNNIKVMDKDGNFLTKEGTTENREEAMSIWDAHTVGEGYKLELDPRVAKNTRNMMTESHGVEEDFELSMYLKYLNADLNGNYDPKNKALLQTHVAGQAVMMLRKWIPRGAKTRFGGINESKGKLMVDRDNQEFMRAGYVESLKDVQEGRYTTAYNYIASMFRGFKQHKFNVAANAKENYAKMTDIERANMRKNGLEFAMMLMMFAAASMLAAMADDEENEGENNNWLWFLAYITKRAQSELMFYINPAEMIKTIDSPAVALKTLGDIADTIGYAVFHHSETWKSGDNAGSYKWMTSAAKLSPYYRIHTQMDRDFEKSYNFQVRGGFR